MTSHRFSPIARRTALLAGVLLSAAACSDDATGPQPARLPSGISAVDNPDLVKIAAIPPVVDGTFSPGEYDGAAVIKYVANTPPSALGTGVTSVSTFVTHDGTYLYIATVFDRKSPFHPADRVGYEFDSDNDGVRENGDDILITGASGSPHVVYPGADFYRWNNGVSNQSDAATGGTIDVISAWGAVGTKGVFETRHPLNSADDTHDFSINPLTGAVTVGMEIMVALELNPVGSGTFVSSFKPSSTTYCQLTIGKKTTSVTCP
jgi:hypothetical protein